MIVKGKMRKERKDLVKICCKRWLERESEDEMKKGGAEWIE